MRKTDRSYIVFDDGVKVTLKEFFSSIKATLFWLVLILTIVIISYIIFNIPFDQ